MTTPARLERLLNRALNAFLMGADRVTVEGETFTSREQVEERLREVREAECLTGSP